MSEQEQHGDLEARIAASRRSLVPSPLTADAEPPESYTALAREYPIALVAGGLAMGLVAGMLLPRGFARKAARGAMAVATLASEAGRSYGSQALEAGREAGHKIEGLGETAGSIGRRAVAGASDTVRKGRSLGHKTAVEVIRIVAKLRR